MSMSEPVYKALEEHSNLTWTCCQCGFPNFSTLFLNSFISVENPYSPLQNQDQDTSFPTPEPNGQPLATSSPVKKTKKHKADKIKINILNCRSIRSTEKRSRLQTLIASTEPDILFGTESHLGPDYTNAETFDPNYNVFRKDRKEGGGGVFLLIKHSFIVTPLPELDTKCEIIWCKLETFQTQPFLLGAYYRPPDATDESICELQRSLQIAKEKHGNCNIILAGDFNLGSIDWEHQSVPTGSNLKRHCDLLLDTANDHGLTQIVDIPTYRNSSILDLLFTSTPGLSNKVTTAPGISDNDHDLVQVEMNIKAKINKKTPRKVFIYSKADLTQIRYDLIAFDHTFTEIEPTSRTVNENWIMFREAFSSILNKNIPSKTLNGKWNQPWINQNLKRQVKKKQRMYAKAKDTNKRDDWKNYRQCRNQTKRNIKKQYWTYMNTIIDPDKDKAHRKLFKFIKSQKKDTSGVSPLKTTQGLLSKSKDKAEALNQQFKSAFTPPDPSPHPDKGPSPHPIMPDFTVTENGVLKLLEELNPNKAPGPDGVSGKILKTMASEIAPILTIIFRQSMETGNLPDDWKKANIAPIFKKGDRSNPANYRPVSLTSIACKMLEHIVASNVLEHLNCNNILVDQQHGFRAKRSCESQLIQTVHDLALGLDTKVQHDIGILDFSKAFDKVSHNKLLSKLDWYGIKGKTHSWLQDFLVGRKQQVVVDGESSGEIDVTSGVPQGTVLGPILFIIYINDITEGIKSQIRLFADDCLIYHPIYSENDCEILQDDLNTLATWADTWQMKFNLDKSFIMNITLAKKNTTKNNYHLCDHSLEIVNSTPYLGVTITKDLKWNIHIDNITTKANRMLNFIRRNLKGCPQPVKEKAYQTYVRPLTEYCSTVWDPHTKENIEKLEKVQRRAARFVTNNYQQKASVTEMINNLGWDTLQCRRKYANLILFYRVAHKTIAIPFTYLPPMMTGHYNTRHHNHLAFQLPQCRINSYKYSFFPRTTLLWNVLPSSVVSATLLENFKVELFKHSQQC
jgi:hypothetical protein